MLPEKYKENMKNLLGEEYPAYIQSFEEGRYYGLRLNTLKWQLTDFDISSYECEPVPWCEEGFYYNKDYQPTKDPYYYAGLYYIQEPSAMSPAAIFDIQPGERVLDLCAAPGGKSTHLGAKLQGEGILVSNDISVTRTKALLKNIEIFGITNAIVISEEPEKLAKPFEAYFDKILVDAPCSGEGMFRKEPGIIKSWEERGIEYYTEIQKNILTQAAKMLKPGGQLLYSTCTFNPLENEGTIKYFLENHEEFKLIPIDKSKGFSDGHPEWVDGPNELEDTARLWPHKIKGEGHFIALMRKEESGEDKSDERVTFKEDYPQNNKKELKYFDTFCKEILHRPITGSICIINEKVYQIPNELPSLKGIRALRTGWLLGELKKNRFEPAPAFAMGIKKKDVKHTLNLNRDDERVIRYLKGETIEAKGQDGWLLVCVDGFPLGWGKCLKGRVKNKYSKSWRWK